MSLESNSGFCSIAMTFFSSAAVYPGLWETPSIIPCTGYILGTKWYILGTYQYVLCMYLCVQVHSLYALQSNQFVPVFQGMLVQDKFGWCKSLLLLLGHARDKTAFQRDFVFHCLTCLDNWHLQAPKQTMQVIETAVPPFSCNWYCM